MVVFGDLDGPVFAQDHWLASRRFNGGGVGHRGAHEGDPPRAPSGGVDRSFRLRKIWVSSLRYTGVAFDLLQLLYSRLKTAVKGLQLRLWR